MYICIYIYMYKWNIYRSCGFLKHTPNNSRKILEDSDFDGLVSLFLLNTAQRNKKILEDPVRLMQTWIVYPLVNSHITIDKSAMLNGKTHENQAMKPGANPWERCLTSTARLAPSRYTCWRWVQTEWSRGLMVGGWCRKNIEPKTAAILM